MSSFGRYLQFALVAALGAGLFAGLAQLIWSLVPEPKAIEQVDCQETVMMLSLDKSFSMVEDGSPSLRLVRDAVNQFVNKAQEDDACLLKTIWFGHF